MAQNWYARINGHVHGPFDTQTLKSLRDHGEIQPSDYVRKGEDGKWVLAQKVAGLFDDSPRSAVIQASSEPAEPLTGRSQKTYSATGNTPSSCPAASGGSASAYYDSAPPVPPPPNLGSDFSGDPATRRKQSQPHTYFDLRGFLTFQVMITPILIQIFFWLGLAITNFFGLSLIIASFVAVSPDEFVKTMYNNHYQPQHHFSIFLFMLGVAILIIGPLVIRLICEQAIIFFRIYTELQKQTNLVSGSHQ